MFITAQILGLIGAMINILSLQNNNKNRIILLFAFANVFISVSLLFLGARLGAVISIFGVIEILYLYSYKLNIKKSPKMLIYLLMISSVVLTLIEYKSIIDVVPMICFVVLTIKTIQKNNKNIRIVSLIHTSIWLIYNLYVKAFTISIADVVMIISNLSAIYKYDFKKAK